MMKTILGCIVSVLIIAGLTVFGIGCAQKAPTPEPGNTSSNSAQNPDEQPDAAGNDVVDIDPDQFDFDPSPQSSASARR